MLSGLSYSPSLSPVDPAFLYRHLRLLSPTDHAMADTYAQIATEMIENHCNRYFLEKSVVWTVTNDDRHTLGQTDPFYQPWQWSYITTNPVIRLPRPATSIASVTIGVWGDVSDVLMIEGTDYYTDFSTSIARIKWISSTYLQSEKDHLQISFTSGYGTTPDTIPASLKHAIILLTMQLFEMRGDTNPELLSPAIMALIAPYQFVSFG